MSQADSALYNAKHNGKNTYRFYTPNTKLQNTTPKEKVPLYLKNIFIEAIQKEKISVTFQAQTNILHQSIIGIEVFMDLKQQLSKKEHQELFAYIEDEGLMIPAGYKTMKKAILKLAQWINHKKISVNTTLWFNLTHKQFFDPLLLKFITNELSIYKLSKQNIGFEVDDALFFSQPSQYILQVQHFKKEGYQVSIDNLGSPLTQLEKLAHVKVPRIKLNKEKMGFLNSKNDEALIECMINYCHAIDIETLATGIEEKAQLTWLHEHKCLDYQGYIIHKPNYAEDFEKVLDRFAV